MLLVQPGGALRSQAQATYQVPLGSAAAYGLLSAGSITAQDTVPNSVPVNIPIQVLGKAGAGQSIGPLVTGTAGVFAQSNGNVPAALADLQNAQTYCGSFYSPSAGQIPAQLDGQTLAGGVYNGEATLIVQGWATGLYQLIFIANGRVLGSQRVTISHE